MMFHDVEMNVQYIYTYKYIYMNQDWDATF